MASHGNSFHYAWSDWTANRWNHFAIHCLYLLAIVFFKNFNHLVAFAIDASKKVRNSLKAQAFEQSVQWSIARMTVWVVVFNILSAVESFTMRRGISEMKQDPSATALWPRKWNRLAQSSDNIFRKITSATRENVGNKCFECAYWLRKLKLFKVILTYTTSVISFETSLNL